MKKILTVVMVLASISTFAGSKDEYCQAARTNNLNEINRLVQLAAEQTETEEIDRIMEEMSQVESIQVLTANYCKI